MKLFQTLFILLLNFHYAFSQTSETLEIYIKQGLQANLALQQKNLNLEKSILALKEANGLFYPSVELNVQYMFSNGGRSIDLPVGDMLNPVYSSLNQILQNMGQQGGFPNVNNEKIQFLPNDYHDTKLRVILPLVNSEIYYNQKIKKELISYSEAEVNVYKRELVKEIKIAYCLYLQSVKVVEAYLSARELVAEGIRVNEKLIKNEMAGNEKLLRMKAEMGKVEAQLSKAENDKKTALSYFNFLLNQPLQTQIQVDSSLFYNKEVIDQSIDVPFHQREELEQLKIAKGVTGLNLNRNKAFWFPSVSLVPDFGFQGYQYKFNSEQKYIMSVIELKWNIFSSMQNKIQVSQAQIDYSSMEKKYNETEQQIELQSQVAWNSLEASKNQETAIQMAMIASIKEFRQNGIGSLLFQKLIEEAKLRNLNKVELHATPDGEPIYKKFGFVDPHDKALELIL